MRQPLQNLLSQHCNTLMKADYEHILPRLSPVALKELEIIFQEKKDKSPSLERDAYDYLLTAVRSFLPIFEEINDD
jgi:hypothetical protein